MSKYGNLKAERDGLVFDSRAERRRYDELRLLELAGAIQSLTVQPEYELQPAFRRDGKIIRAIKYRGDFAYTENGAQVVEDCKGFHTQAFEIKRKLFLYRYPTIEFRVVPA